ncbi:MAG: DUF1289 domain-containing protein [Gammaproteobacteria bacterium]|nr:DUF1289 domain-containing protein [Gammaproteobacteria bacterium]
MSRPRGPASSPCVGICTLDPERRYCTGCLRTLGEIAGWSGMGPAEREAVWAALEVRKKRDRPEWIGAGGA